MGGSDSEISDSDDEYMPGPEMYQQYMYNANMYNAMMLSMMPCVPMPCIPPYGCASPYPPIMNQFPVNHMAAGPYYKNGGRSRTNKRKSRSKEGEHVKHRPHHRQRRVVQRHQYYHSSSESDDEDECLDTMKKGVRACQSVNSNGTLGHPTLVPSSHGQALNDVSVVHKRKVDFTANLPNLPLPNNSHDIDSNKNGHLNIRTARSCTNTAHINKDQTIPEIAADCNKMPLNRLESKTAVATMIGCQGQNAISDVKIAANLPLNCVASSQSNSKLMHQSVTAAETVLSNNVTHDTQGDESRPAANHLPLSNYSPHDFIVNTEAEDSQSDDIKTSKCVSPNSDLISEHETAITSKFEPNSPDLDITGSTPADERQPEDRQVRPVEDSGRSEVYIDHPEHEDQIVSTPHTPAIEPENFRRENRGSPTHCQDYGGEGRSAVLRIKYLQSLHNLHKEWLEWETKFRPPPVSIYSLRGAGPENL